MLCYLSDIRSIWTKKKKKKKNCFIPIMHLTFRWPSILNHTFHVTLHHDEALIDESRQFLQKDKWKREGFDFIGTRISHYQWSFQRKQDFLHLLQMTACKRGLRQIWHLGLENFVSKMENFGFKLCVQKLHAGFKSRTSPKFSGLIFTTA